MAVTVYIWRHDRAGNWGHTSLATDMPACYVSWWPDANRDLRVYAADTRQTGVFNRAKVGMVQAVYGTTNVYKTRHETSAGYLDDVRKEGGHADVKFKITGLLNEAAISRWWQRYNYETASYHVVKKNCSTTVFRALRAGGSDNRVAFGLRDFGFHKYFGNEPTTVHAYLRNMAARHPSNVATEDSQEAIQDAVGTESDGVQMCTIHGYPLYECPSC